jgi:hypothetical protein
LLSELLSAPDLSPGPASPTEPPDRGSTTAGSPTASSPTASSPTAGSNVRWLQRLGEGSGPLTSGGRDEAKWIVEGATLAPSEIKAAVTNLGVLSKLGWELSPWWQQRPELAAQTPSLLALASLRWPTAEKPDYAKTAQLRDELGRNLVRQLWLAVEKDPPAGIRSPRAVPDPSDPTGIKDFVTRAAQAATRAATTGGEPAAYLGANKKLTSALVRAVIDQTLLAVQPWAGPLCAEVEQHRDGAITQLVSLRNFSSGGRNLRKAWEHVMEEFLALVNATAGPYAPQVWAALDHLLRRQGPTPAPRHLPQRRP